MASLVPTLITFSVLGMVLFLALAEYGRYRIAREDSEHLPYPRSRLIRRELIATLISVVLLALYFKPEPLQPLHELAWLGGCLVGAFIILWLTWRDLRETSVKVVDAHNRFRKEAGEELRNLYEEVSRQEKASSEDGKPE